MSRFLPYAAWILAAALCPAGAAAQGEWASLRFTHLEMRDSCGAGDARGPFAAPEAIADATHVYEENVCSTLGRGDRARTLFDGRVEAPSAEDPVEAELRDMGHEGFLIARAREEVSGILGEENACTAWYREGEPDPLRKFRTLRFATDGTGDAAIEAHYDYRGSFTVHEPYVARAQQLVGAGSTITLNAHGAFFERDAPFGRHLRGGGPLSIEPPRDLHVGSYLGATLRAQVTTLLHEYAHIVGLLPVDAGHPEAGLLSTRNTAVVLAHCQKQIDGSETRMIVLPVALAAEPRLKRKD